MIQGITAAVFVVYALCVVVYFATAIKKVNNKLPLLYRKVVNLPFAITTKELTEEYEATKDPVQASMLPFKLIGRSLTLFATKRTGSKELDVLAARARRIILLSGGLIIVGFAVFLLIEINTA